MESLTVLVTRPDKRVSTAEGFLKVGPGAGQLPRRTGISKNASGFVDIPLKRGPSGAKQ